MISRRFIVLLLACSCLLSSVAVVADDDGEAMFRGARGLADDAEITKKTTKTKTKTPASKKHVSTKPETKVTKPKKTLSAAEKTSTAAKKSTTTTTTKKHHHNTTTTTKTAEKEKKLVTEPEDTENVDGDEEEKADAAEDSDVEEGGHSDEENVQPDAAEEEKSAANEEEEDDSQIDEEQADAEGDSKTADNETQQEDGESGSETQHYGEEESDKEENAKGTESKPDDSSVEKDFSTYPCHNATTCWECETIDSDSIAEDKTCAWKESSCQLISKDEAPSESLCKNETDATATEKAAQPDDDKGSFMPGLLTLIVIAGVLFAVRTYAEHAGVSIPGVGSIATPRSNGSLHRGSSRNLNSETYVYLLKGLL